MMVALYLVLVVGGAIGRLYCLKKLAEVESSELLQKADTFTYSRSFENGATVTVTCS